MGSELMPKKPERILKKIKSIYFAIGVNVIGLPEMIKHQVKLYQYEQCRNFKKY
jgi:hypothetical protein